MQVVHATYDDARAVAEIHVDTWRAAYASIVPADYLASLSVERREAMWRECIATRVPELLVATEAGVVRGWLSFCQCRDEGSSKAEAEIWATYVAPSSWSGGAGRLLWLRAKELMLEQGFKSCSLWGLPAKRSSSQVLPFSRVCPRRLGTKELRAWRSATSRGALCLAT